MRMKSVRPPFLLPTRACGIQAEKLADFMVKFPSLRLTATADIVVTGGVRTPIMRPRSIVGWSDFWRVLA